MRLDPASYPGDYPQADEGSQLWFVQQLLWANGCKWGQFDDWQCPAHNDENASLSVAQGETGVVLHCHAGCLTVIVLAKLGVKWGHVLAHEPGEPEAASPGKPGAGAGSSTSGTLSGAQAKGLDELAARHGGLVSKTRYTYRTAANCAQGADRVQRYVWRFEFADGTKTIRQKINPALKGVAALYRQDLVELAREKGLPVYVVEGEKNAAEFNRYAKGKAVATSAPGGAGEWSPEHGRLLAGIKRVVVIADRDEPGRKHAEDVLASLVGVVRRVEAKQSATTGKGDDLSDHLAAGYAVKDLAPVPLELDRDETKTDASGRTAVQIDIDEISDELRKASAPWPAPGDPLAVARKLVEVFRHGDGNRKVMRWRDDWWWWTAGRWHRIEEEGFHGQIQALLDGEYYLAGQPPEPKPWPTHPRFTRPVLATLAGLVHIEGDTRPGVRLSAAAEGGAGLRPLDLLPLRNDVLDLSEGAHFARLEPSPDYFTLHALPFDLDTSAECHRWEQFLDETFGGDAEAIALLQEWFGYCLTGETARQKFLALYGPPGSGKTTVQRVLEALLGPDAAIAVTFSSLGSQFGLDRINEAQLAVVGDARWDGRGNEAVVEAINNLVGETPIRVERKYKAAVRAMATARLMLVSNERPALRDPSQALMRRMMVLETRYTVPEEHRNPRLFAQLEKEMSGIVNWALAGLGRLRKHGQFTVPESSRGELRSIARAQSEIADFIEERCELKDGAWVSKAELHRAYREWREDNDIPGGMSSNTMTRQIKAALGGTVTEFAKRSGSSPKARGFLGLRLVPRHGRV